MWGSDETPTGARVDDDGGGPGDFASRLDALKSRGGSVLVTGGGSREAHLALCRRLLGDGEDLPRRRLLVFTDGESVTESRLPPGTDVTTITTSVVRSAAARSVTPTEPDPGAPDATTLAEIGTSIVAACEAFERDHGPLDPAEVRIGVDSLVPLLEAHGRRRVFVALVLLTHYARWLDALAHVHLRVDRRAYVPRLVAPLFDAVVEVRQYGGQLQQRWHLDDGAVTSPWLSI